MSNAAESQMPISECRASSYAAKGFLCQTLLTVRYLARDTGQAAMQQGDISLIETVFLNNHTWMPRLGIGMNHMENEKAVITAINSAVTAGYRMIDTASSYRNEEYIGQAIAKCQIPRRDLFIISKVWNTAQRLGDTAGAFERSLERLQLNYVDLYMIHWPVPGCYGATWDELAKLSTSRAVLAIGVSNFEIRHLEALRKASGIVPAVNQIECHPLNYNKDLIDYCQSNGIEVQAYAPLAGGACLDEDIICVVATKYARTPAQIALRWAIQKGLSVIPGSSNTDHIRSNADIFSFEIEEEDMAILDTMSRGYRSAGIPDDLKDIPF